MNIAATCVLHACQDWAVRNAALLSMAALVATIGTKNSSLERVKNQAKVFKLPSQLNKIPDHNIVID